MWWKFYFFFSLILVLLSILSFWQGPGQNIPVHIFLIVTFCIALVGLFSVAFHKKIFSRKFWLYYFWFYVLLDTVYFVLGFLPAPVLKYVTFLLVYPKPSAMDSLINTALDIPVIYAMYALWHEDLFTANSSKKKSNKPFRWGMIQTALWGYASVLIFFLFIVSFFPVGGSGSSKGGGTDPIYSTVMFAPLFIFWLWIVTQYKNYRWNWWRTTLLANGLLYSGTIIFGILFSSTGQQNTSGSGIDIIGILQLAILLISLYVFGRDQFIPQPKQNRVRKPLPIAKEDE